MKKNLRWIGLLGNAFIFLLGYLILTWNGGMLKPLENALYDMNQERTKSSMPHERILVVTIDEKSIEHIGQFPWPREIYGVLVEQMNVPGFEATAIGFDILFDTETNPDSDGAFAEALAQYDNVVLPSVLATQSDLSRFTRVKKDELIMAHGITKPIPAFAEVTRNAHINAVIDEDRTIRRTWLQLNTPEDGVIPSLAYEMALMAGADVEHFPKKHPQAELYIDFDSESYDFFSVSFIDVLTGDFPLENFQDMLVLVGMTAIGLNTQDTGRVPIEKEMPLVYAHANILNQLLNDTYISYTADWIVILCSLLLFIIVLLLTWRFKTVTSVSIVLALSVILLAGQHVVYREWHTFIDTVHPVAIMLLTYLTNISIKAFFEQKHKNFITKQFGRYISPDLVKQIARSEQELPLGGMNKELSILFLDIRGFTTLSEKLKPEEVVDFLNTMFDLITEKTLDNKGTIDKFIGDAAMLLFNAPLDLANHEYYAVKTAYDIQRGMESVRQAIQEKHGVSVSVGIGVNTGEVVVGNIGSYLRVDYTAIGDNVNTAARIESNTEANQILVSETTYERTKDHFKYECIGERMMKGKTVPVKLYEVQGLKRELADGLPKA